MALNVDLLVKKLVEAGHAASTGVSLSFGLEELYNASLNEDVARIYQALNGSLKTPPIVPAKPMIVIGGAVFLELDDHSQFNRYRAITLRSSIYERIRGIDHEKYRRYCRIYEKECLKPGLKEGVWASSESIACFGEPSNPGDFFGNGSPGWKLKAYKAFLLDILAAAGNIQVARIPCYDNMLINNELTRIGKLYENNSNWEPLIRYINKKLSDLWN